MVVVFCEEVSSQVVWCIVGKLNCFINIRKCDDWCNWVECFFMYDIYGCIDIGEYCWVNEVVVFVIVLVICVFCENFCIFFNCIINLVNDFFEVFFVDDWVDIDIFFKFIFDF